MQVEKVTATTTVSLAPIKEMDQMIAEMICGSLSWQNLTSGDFLLVFHMIYDKIVIVWIPVRRKNRIKDAVVLDFAVYIFHVFFICFSTKFNKFIFKVNDK